MDKRANPRQRILGFPLTKIVIGLTVCLGIGLLGWLGVKELLNTTTLREETRDLIAGSILALLVVLSYRELFTRYENRDISELSAKACGRNLLGGIILGVALQLLVFLVMYLQNDFKVVAVNRVFLALPTMALMFVEAITTEILIIGILFRIMEEALGSYISLALLSIIFIVMHIGAPDTSFIGAFCVALHGGFLLGAAYIFSRNLWFVIAIHFAWDFMQAGFFGASVSGYRLGNALLVTKIEGSPWVVGGYLGPGSSVQAGIFCLLAAIVLLIVSHNNQRIVGLKWNLKRSG
jgi:uncharacterized protein